MSHDQSAPLTKGPSGVTAHHRLLARARASNAAAWERLVSLYAPLVQSWCRGWGLQADDAADVFQEVFRAVVTHLDGFHCERSGGTFRGWIRAITRNKVNDHFRRRKREPVAIGGSEARELLAQVPAAEELSSPTTNRGVWLCRALEVIRGEFEPRTWEAFWQTAVEGRAVADVSADLAMSRGAVRVAKSRVLHRLRRALGVSVGCDAESRETVFPERGT